MSIFFYRKGEGTPQQNIVDDGANAMVSKSLTLAFHVIKKNYFQKDDA